MASCVRHDMVVSVVCLNDVCIPLDNDAQTTARLYIVTLQSTSTWHTMNDNTDCRHEMTSEIMMLALAGLR